MISSLFLQNNLKTIPKFLIDFPLFSVTVRWILLVFSFVFYCLIEFHLKFIFFDIFSFCDVFFGEKNMSFGEEVMNKKQIFI